MKEYCLRSQDITLKEWQEYFANPFEEEVGDEEADMVDDGGLLILRFMLCFSMAAPTPFKLPLISDS